MNGRKLRIVSLGFAFLFLAEILCPLKLTSVSFEVKRALLAFARAEPEDRPIILNIHLTCACWEIATAK
jgi:hypothetical protein